MHLIQQKVHVIENALTAFPSYKMCSRLFKIPPIVASPFSLNSPRTNLKAILLFPTPDSPRRTSLICLDFPSGPFRAPPTGGPEARPFGRLAELIAIQLEFNLKENKWWYP